jgi:hypothetical protein
MYTKFECWMNKKRQWNRRIGVIIIVPIKDSHKPQGASKTMKGLRRNKTHLIPLPCSDTVGLALISHSTTSRGSARSPLEAALLFTLHRFADLLVPSCDNLEEGDRGEKPRKW